MCAGSLEFTKTEIEQNNKMKQMKQFHDMIKSNSKEEINNRIRN